MTSNTKQNTSCRIIYSELASAISVLETVVVYCILKNGNPLSDVKISSNYRRLMTAKCLEKLIFFISFVLLLIIIFSIATMD